MYLFLIYKNSISSYCYLTNSATAYIRLLLVVSDPAENKSIKINQI